VRQGFALCLKTCRTDQFASEFGGEAGFEPWAEVGHYNGLASHPYAAFWKLWISRIQLVSGFHLGQIWATISKSLIPNG
jgi:hypothetical protein